MRRSYIEELNDSKVKHELHEGEQILWQGEPSPFAVVNESSKKQLVIRWIVCALAFAAVTAAYAILVSRSSAGFSWVVTAVIFVICFFIAMIPMLDAKRVMNKCSFYVTDDRVVSVIDAREFMAMSRKGVKTRFVDAGNGCIHILMGAYVDKPAKKLITSTVVGKRDEKENITGLVFYNVKDDGKLRAVLAN